MEMAVGLAAAGLAGLVPDWVQINLPGVNSVARGIVGHRGLSHWVLTALAVGGIARLAVPCLALPILAGWCSHIIVDIFSGGVSALWPWPGRITLAKIKTGTWQDALIGAACLVLAITIGLARVT
jgi:membrane-bound metal-dependent hydrolase YbcI (DUF457 family)